MRNLRDVLVSDYGLDLDGWVLSEARGTSADGRVIVGWGSHDGVEEAWLAHLPGPCLGDLNQDGSVNILDLFRLIGGMGPCTDCAACPADLNGNCAVDLADVFLLLGNWGSCGDSD